MRKRSVRWRIAYAVFIEAEGYDEFIPSALTYENLWTDKAGPEILGQMWTFPGKGENPDRYTLSPEITGIAQKLYRDAWSKSLPKPIKLWYLTRCYRYEKPQAGRYREFWQLGVERLGPYTENNVEAVYALLQTILKAVLPNTSYTLETGMTRGLAYYTRQDRNIEVVCPLLGAQKQLAGGGTYTEGVGWAIGIDRLLLAIERLGLTEVLIAQERNR
jgi:histidyl-tRNA synthetase